MVISPTGLEVKPASLFGDMESLGHEQVVFCSDKATGLKALIGIHSTVLGPSLGGVRFWNYENEQDALRDVLRLSRGMSLKNSIAGLDLGGGKAVILGDPRSLKSPELMKRFGQFVQTLSGNYITAEDVGVGEEDMVAISSQTKHVAGLPTHLGGGGDPSPFTAYGVYLGMKAAAKKAFGTDSLAGKRIAVQGAGHVAQNLVPHLVKEGAILVISDFFEEKALKLATEFGIKSVGRDEIYDADMDIFAPCALGAIVNDDTLARLKCQVIAGAANNQLADEKRHGYALKDRGIVYAPDFLINGGGVINCYQEVIGYDKAKAWEKVERIYDYTLRIFAHAEAEDLSSAEAAVQIAERRIASKGQVQW